MRVLLFAVAMMSCAGNLRALETSAGADTVNASQVGITTKIDSSNAILTTDLNQILQCNLQGKLFNSTTSACADPTEPLAHKIADCTSAHNFYNQTTEQCEASPPDLTNEVTSATTDITSMLACSANAQFYNSATKTCVRPQLVSAGSKTVQTASQNSAASGTVKGPQVCVVTNDGRWGSGNGNCTVSGSPGGTWTVKATSGEDTNIQCSMACYNFK